jgi:hypothetical protein
MVDLLYRFAKRASRLPSEDSDLDLCAKLRFLRLHNGELALDKRAIHSAAAALDIAKAPARYSATGAGHSIARHSSRQETQREKLRFCEIWVRQTLRNRWENKNEQWWTLIIPRSLKLTPGKRAHRAW